MDSAIEQLSIEVKDLQTDSTPKGQLFESAKQISNQLIKLKQYIDANNARDMITGARDLTNIINQFIANAQTVAEKSVTRSIREQFVSSALKVKHYGVQIKMLLAVRAAGSAAQQAGSSTEEDQLKTCIKGIVDCVLEVIQSDDVFEDEDPFAGGNWKSNAAFTAKN